LSNKSVLVNSGFYDNRNLIKNLAPGQKFVLLYKENTDTHFRVDIGVATYSTQTGHYLPMDSVFLSFDSSEGFTYPLSDLKYKNYKFIIGTVPDNYNITDEKSYKKLKT
jgi:hypothetical protein